MLLLLMLMAVTLSLVLLMRTLAVLLPALRHGRSTSIAPVAISGLSISAGRGATVPSIITTLSIPIAAAAAIVSAAVHCGLNEHCTTPPRSRRSRKT